MSRPIDSASSALRVCDLVPLRRMLGSDSIVMRVNPDGTFAPFQRMPSLFFGRAIRSALGSDVQERFIVACAEAVTTLSPVVFRPDLDRDDDLLINPILDNDSNDCRFLVCWARGSATVDGHAHIGWADLRLDQVTTRYRRRANEESLVVDASPWWDLKNGEVLELWPHHAHVSAMGLGHAVMEMLIMDAAEAAAEMVGGPAVQIVIPSADMLAGLVPVFHGALRASGVTAGRLVVAVDVEIAADPDLLPILVHLRTMGIKIDIVGLDALTSTLHKVSDTSTYTHPIALPAPEVKAPWVATLPEAAAQTL